MRCKTKTILLTIILFLFVHNMTAQVVRKDTRVRIFAGVSTLLSDAVNDHIRSFEAQTKSFDFDLDMSTFGSHFLFGLEYEKYILKNISVQASFEYHNEFLSGYDYYTATGLETEHGLNYDFTFSVFALSAVYYHPVFDLNLGKAYVFAGAGGELIYTSVELDYFFNPVQDQTRLQVIRLDRTGYSSGTKIFAGMEIPFLPSVFLQMRAGISYRPISGLSEKLEKNIESPLNSDVFKVEEYNYSDLHLVLGLAYLF